MFRVCSHLSQPIIPYWELIVTFSILRLLFAGSSRVTIANHIEYVQGLLGIVVSEVAM